MRAEDLIKKNSIKRPNIYDRVVPTYFIYLFLSRFLPLRKFDEIVGITSDHKSRGVKKLWSKISTEEKLKLLAALAWFVKHVYSYVAKIHGWFKYHFEMSPDEFLNALKENDPWIIDMIKTRIEMLQIADLKLREPRKEKILHV